MFYERVCIPPSPLPCRGYSIWEIGMSICDMLLRPAHGCGPLGSWIGHAYVTVAPILCACQSNKNDPISQLEIDHSMQLCMTGTVHR